MPSDVPTRKQTLSYLRRLFSERGLSARSDMGQNFLIDLNLQQLLVDRAEIGRHDVVLEVGAGTGALTRLLAEKAGAVVAVELDRGFHALAAEHVRGLDNVTLLHTDALATKNRVSPNVLDALQTAMRDHGQSAFKLAANLPYSIATPLLVNLLIGSVPMHSATVTVQRELADRMIASPGTSQYNAMSVTIGALAEVQHVRNLGPNVFWPRPKVGSSIVRIVASAVKREAAGDVGALSRHTRMIFSQRRKHILRVLRNHYKRTVGAEQLRTTLESLGIDPQTRAEALPIDQIVPLARSLAQEFPESPAETR